MYNFARVYSDKKRFIKVSLPYYIYTVRATEKENN